MKIMRKIDEIWALFVLYAVSGVFSIIALFTFELSFLWFITVFCAVCSIYVLIRYAISIKKKLTRRNGMSRYMVIGAIALYVIGMSLIFWILANSTFYNIDLSRFDGLATFSAIVVSISGLLLISVPFIDLFGSNKR
jgi:hypothetical protein